MAHRQTRLKGGLVRARPYKDIGHYTVPFGKQDIEFTFDYPLMDVLLSCPSIEMPVCQGNLNWFSVTLLEFGFILHTDIKTDSATITWVTIEGEWSSNNTI